MRALIRCSALAMGLSISLGAAAAEPRADSVVVVFNADTPALDADSLQKVYLGKLVEVNGRAVIPVNLARGNALRNAFMEQFLTQDDEKFVAYWTVRRYIGKGIPPREFATLQEQIQFLRSTPGAVGYVDGRTEISKGLKTYSRKP